MKYALIVEPEAERDLITAIKWYESQRAGLGPEFELSVEAILQRIVRLPELAGRVHVDIRRRSVPKFPFGVFYRIEGRLIRIVAVMHTSRDPNSWQSRA